MTEHFRRSSDMLSRIPNELLFEIKKEIPITDLRTHVCFHKTHERIAAQYGSDDVQDKFWERACWLSGLGLMRQETLLRVSWKDIAYQCIEKCGFCKHPKCGMALLERNVAGMAGIDDILAQAGLDPGRAMPEHAYRFLDERDIDTNSVLGDLSFNDPTSQPGTSDLVTCLRQRNLVPSKFECRLRMHPIVLRSFATFPPVRKIVLLDLFDIQLQDCFRSSGVTVWDVQLSLYSVLSEPLSQDTVCEFMDWPSGYIPNRKQFQDAFYRYKTLYGILSDAKLLGLDVEECNAQEISLRMVTGSL
ncbi:hypothetical protein B0H21DRAFT_449018 [Amylocystis lapponica]|nr:hypothetical protein B0H21DRAFT_449018 [Amylocystis lapponica]